MWRSLGLGSLIALSVFVGACSSSTQEDGRDDSFVGKGKGDTGGIAEGSYEAGLVLAVANTASIEALTESAPEGVGLGQRTADNLGYVRLGDDGLSGTADDGRFYSLAELDAVPYVGPIAFEKMLAYAERNHVGGFDLGWQPGGDLPPPYGNADGGAPATWDGGGTVTPWDFGGPAIEWDLAGPQPTWDLSGPWAYDAAPSNYFGPLPKQADGSVWLNGSGQVDFYKSLNGVETSVKDTMSCSLYGPSTSALSLSCVSTYGSSLATVSAVDGSFNGSSGTAWMGGTVTPTGGVSLSWFSVANGDAYYSVMSGATLLLK